MRVELELAPAPHGEPRRLVQFIGVLQGPMTIDGLELVAPPNVIGGACILGDFSVGAERPVVAHVWESDDGLARTYFALRTPATMSAGAFVTLLAEGASRAVLIGRELGESLKHRRSCPHCGGRL